EEQEARGGVLSVAWRVGALVAPPGTARNVSDGPLFVLPAGAALQKPRCPPPTSPRRDSFASAPTTPSIAGWLRRRRRSGSRCTPWVWRRSSTSTATASSIAT